MCFWPWGRELFYFKFFILKTMAHLGEVKGFWILYHFPCKISKKVTDLGILTSRKVLFCIFTSLNPYEAAEIWNFLIVFGLNFWWGQLIFHIGLSIFFNQKLAWGNKLLEDIFGHEGGNTDLKCEFCWPKVDNFSFFFWHTHSLQKKTPVNRKRICHCGE